MKTDETHDSKRTSWVESANGHSEFPIQNLPLGIFSRKGERHRIGVAIGNSILDVAAVATHGLIAPKAVVEDRLNPYMTLPAEERLALRRRLSELLSDAKYRAQIEPHVLSADACTMHLPAVIGDYTDFYVGIHHAMNVGRQFRPDQPLMPNYKYVPIGYHGRASSVRVSGEAVRRPNGQRKPPDAPAPAFGPAKRLDYELEMGIWIGPGNALGDAIPIEAAHSNIAGYCLLNDWSARDLQAWEYQPLGPFLAKSFHTTISPWVVTSEALAPFRMAQEARPEGDPRPLDYLWSDDDQQNGAFAIELVVSLRTARMREEKVAPHVIARSAAKHMYWTMAQIVTHHASNGCNLRAGDLLGTGTISTPDATGLGSLLEATKGGAEPMTLATGETRTFLEDGDEITLAATAKAAGRTSIGFGACTAVVLPAR